MIAVTNAEGEVCGPEILCTACYRSLGTFNREILLRALLDKGDILCPGCRKLHCQFCGWVETKPETENLGVWELDGLPYRICGMCKKWVDGEMPKYEKCVANIRPLASEPRSESLSSIS